MRHPFRPFRSPWSLLLVLAAIAFTLGACVEGPTRESQNQDCSYDETTHTCL